jgi:tRNA-splicing ligase RtcB
MKKLSITAKELRAIGYPESPVIPVAMSIIQKYYRFSEKGETIKVLSAVLNAPDSYWGDEILGPIAHKLLPAEKEKNKEIGLRLTGVPFNMFGQEHIEQGAIHQMHIAAKLPISVAGALMPDAHYGYGLPIGGILATNNAVIPYGVGVDIGCRMCLSIFDIPAKELIDRERFFSREIHEATLF